MRGANTFSFTGAKGGQLTSGGSAVAVTVMLKGMRMLVVQMVKRCSACDN